MYHIDLTTVNSTELVRQVRHDHPSGLCGFLVSQAALAHFAEQVAAPFQEEWRPQEIIPSG